MSAPYNVAIVGAGIGGEHSDGYAVLPDLFRVKTICDLNAGRASLIAERSGAKVESDIAKVLNDPKIDIIDICLPPMLHYQAVEKALRYGKHVICEKPLTTSISDADRLIKVALETRKRVFPIFQYRYGLATSRMRALIDAGLTGKPLIATLETHWSRDSLYYSVDWRGTWAGEQGGVILGHAIHIHDLLTFIFGPIQSVFADVATLVNTIEVEDCAALSIRMKSGALVTSSTTLGAAKDTSRLKFCFEGLTVESENLPYNPADGQWTFTARAPYEQSKVDACVNSITFAHPSFSGFFEAVAQALQGDDSSTVMLEDAKQSLELVTAIYASARRNMRVTLPISTTHPLYGGWLP
jgi:predicted dehydrogenase